MKLKKSKHPVSETADFKFRNDNSLSASGSRDMERDLLRFSRESMCLQIPQFLTMLKKETCSSGIVFHPAIYGMFTKISLGWSTRET